MNETNPLVWITGANGLIGNYLVQTAPRFIPGCRIRALTRADFDLLDFAAVKREFKKDSPQIVLHCAAMTSVADAQKNPGLARRVNCDVTRLLADLAEASQFAFFSTDLVFDGRRGNYVETDPVGPLTFYGETKVVAEKIVLENPRHLVVRTSLNGGTSPSGKRAFNEELRIALQASGQGMTLFTDEFRCPIPAIETARAVFELIQKTCAGLYHLAGAEKLSRWQIGQLLVARWDEISQKSPLAVPSPLPSDGRGEGQGEVREAKYKIRPGSARDFTGPPRALDTSLNLTKIQNALTHPLPALTEWLTTNPHEKF